jgi:hypothetical protein
LLRIDHTIVPACLLQSAHLAQAAWHDGSLSSTIGSIIVNPFSPAQGANRPSSRIRKALHLIGSPQATQAVFQGANVTSDPSFLRWLTPSSQDRLLQWLDRFLWPLWFGGLTFYIGVVVPLGGRVLGSETQGSVTAQVLPYLNGIGLLASLLPLLVRNPATPKLLAILLASLQGIVTVESLWVDQLWRGDGFWEAIDFYTAHRILLWTVTALWCASLIAHLGRTRVSHPQGQDEPPSEGTI